MRSQAMAWPRRWATGEGIQRFGRFELACLAALALAALFAAGATEARADSCPNEAIREQQGSTALPECRAYEQVSPSDKNGNSVGDVLRTSGDGQGIAWISNGAYAEPVGINVIAPYVAKRSASGWATKEIHPAYGPEARPDLINGLGGWLLPADLSHMAFTTPASLDPEDKDHVFGPFGTQDVYAVDLAGNLSWPSRGEGFTANSPIPAMLQGFSEDGSSIFFTSAEPLSPEVPSDSTASQLYRWRGGRLEVVGRTESGALLEGGAQLGNGVRGINIGSGEAGRAGSNEAISFDGTRFLYSGSATPGGVMELYLHEDGQTPKLVSSSHRSGSVGDPADQQASFITATPDLRKVYFVCHSQLTNDAPLNGGAYIYDTVTGELEFSNPDSSDSANPFEYGRRGLSKMSADGSYRYFAETAALAPGAVEGEPNLYVQHDGVRRYIATVGAEGLVVNAAPDGTLRYPSWTAAGISDDGRRFVFKSAKELAGANTAGHMEIYLYDAPSETLACISCRPDGSASAARSTFTQDNSTAVEWTPQVLTPNGHGVFFTSGDRLLAADKNKVDDVYEWHDGTLSLVSSGQSNEPSEFVGMGPDGRDVYFKTTEALTRSDTDGGLIDIYDARVDGGFDERAASACAGEGCQGTPTSVPVLSTPAAVAGGNGAKARRPHARCKARKAGAVKARARKSASSCVKKKKQRKHKTKQAKKARQGASGELRDVRKGR